MATDEQARQAEAIATGEGNGFHLEERTDAPMNRVMIDLPGDSFARFLDLSERLKAAGVPLCAEQFAEILFCGMAHALARARNDPPVPPGVIPGDIRVPRSGGIS